MRLHIVLFALGAWCLQREALLPDMRLAWLLALAVPVFALARVRCVPARVAARSVLAVFSLAAGFFWAAGAAYVRLGDALPSEWEGRDIELVGVVASLPQPYERSVRFEFDVERVL